MCKVVVPPCSTGGPLLVTDMRRGESLFTVDPPAKVTPSYWYPHTACAPLQGVVDAGVSSQGSLLSGVNALVSWNTPTLTSDPQLPRPLEEVNIQLSREALLLIPIVIRCLCCVLCVSVCVCVLCVGVD